MDDKKFNITLKIWQFITILSVMFSAYLYSESRDMDTFATKQLIVGDLEKLHSELACDSEGCALIFTDPKDKEPKMKLYASADSSGLRLAYSPSCYINMETNNEEGGAASLDVFCNSKHISKMSYSTLRDSLIIEHTGDDFNTAIELDTKISSESDKKCVYRLNACDKQR